MIRAIFEDTRNKPGKHDNIKKYCDENGIELIRQQLYVGDYTLVKNQSVCIDTKKDLCELCMDYSHGTSGKGDYGRFLREVARAKAHGIRLIVLIEDSTIHSFDEVAKWKNPQLAKYPHALTGMTLMHRMLDTHINYGTEFLFCSKEQTGSKIIELLSDA